MVNPASNAAYETSVTSTTPQSVLITVVQGVGEFNKMKRSTTSAEVVQIARSKRLSGAGGTRTVSTSSTATKPGPVSARTATASSRLGSASTASSRARAQVFIVEPWWGEFSLGFCVQINFIWIIIMILCNVKRWWKQILCKTGSKGKETKNRKSKRQNK